MSQKSPDPDSATGAGAGTVPATGPASAAPERAATLIIVLTNLFSMVILSGSKQNSQL